MSDVNMTKKPRGALQLLDHGYIKLVSTNGKDADIAAAARLSYGRGTKKKNDDAGLIRYLYMNAHTSPFEMVGMKFQMRLPIFIMRQLVRHRTANLNEYSGRYSIMPRLFYIPEIEQIAAQHETNKQSSGVPLDPTEAEVIRRMMRDISEASFNVYEHLVERGLSRETAREVLPLNTYTEVVWQMDLNNMLKFLWLRDDDHAQWEIQVYAKAIAEKVKEKFPLTYAAYMRKRSSVSLTTDQLFALITGDRTGLPKGELAEVEQLQRRLQQEITAKMVIED